MSQNILPICELFGPTIQGEGRRMGVESFFLRTSSCNLRCCFAGGSICDTAYSSFHPEKSIYSTIDEAALAFKKLCKAHPNVHDLVITGGEPLLWKNGLEEFLSKVWTDDLYVTIETNGTLPMLDNLSKGFKVDLYSVSPKLSTSVGPKEGIDGLITAEEVAHHDKTRINIKNLYNIAMYSRNYQFKFVYSNEDSVKEILDIYKKISEMVNKEDDYLFEAWKRRHPMLNTYIMPEAGNREQLEKNCLPAADAAIANGWNYSDRLHIRIWDIKRGV